MSHEYRPVATNPEVQQTFIPAQTAPEHEQAGFRWNYNDEHGKTALAAPPLTFDDTGKPIMDLWYSHTGLGETTGEAMQLLRYLPYGSRFILGTCMKTHQMADETVDVSVDPLYFKDRSGLLVLAHELGHGKERPVHNQIQATISGGASGLANPAYTEAFQPAVDALTSYIRNSKTFASDLTRLDEAVPLLSSRDRRFIEDNGGVEAFDTDGQHDIAIQAFHPKAVEAISAIKEANAWLRAFAMVDAGQLHPGMSQRERAKYAYAALDTYNSDFGSTLHTDTFAHALRSYK